ncbi:hypothetical protein J1N35_023948 [Gossypium stocksii]|uniref:Uncharacterized protein n=1 Tax=Gossypium stocksii TaxID=47602 RepID=A0A9D4A464_9ROSI|nr:hypothetical protein J1N35_023948 [Gossypium stocksii]
MPEHKLNLRTSTSFLNNGVKVLFKKAENVYIDEDKGVEILLNESEVGNYFQQLKNLHIQNGAMIQYIIKDYTVDFPALRILEIENCPELKAFIHKSIDKDNPTDGVLFNEKHRTPYNAILLGIGYQGIDPTIAGKYAHSKIQHKK